MTAWSRTAGHDGRNHAVPTGPCPRQQRISGQLSMRKQRPRMLWVSMARYLSCWPAALAAEEAPAHAPRPWDTTRLAPPETARQLHTTARSLPHPADRAHANSASAAGPELASETQACCGSVRHSVPSSTSVQPSMLCRQAQEWASMQQRCSACCACESGADGICRQAQGWAPMHQR